MRLESYDPADTYELGKRLGKTARPGMVAALSGDLGCGKTVFTQGFAAGLGVTVPVTSPTFTILQVYEGGRLPLYHFDLYRIGEREELEEIGYEEFFYGQGASLVEWADLFPELFSEETVRIVISKDFSRGEDYRSIEITGAGEDFETGLNASAIDKENDPKEGDAL